MWRASFMLCVASAIAIFSVDAAGKVVTISNGQLQGGSSTYAAGVDAFRSIPYAAPPVGRDGRFKPPRPALDWDGVRDASKWNGKRCHSTAPAAMPPGLPNAPAPGTYSEDCLFLSVYAPANVTSTSKLPVMVWLPGGGFKGNEPDPETLDAPYPSLVKLQHDEGNPVVSVVVQYRVNVFGFLGSESLRDEDGSTGNWGLQDQRMALKWIQKEIAAFGGDKDRVLLYGQSAGAASTSVHVTSPRSEGLFNAVVMESGGFTHWSAKPMDRTQDIYEEVLRRTKCSDVACLQDYDADELTNIAKAIEARCTHEPDPTVACFYGLNYLFYEWAPTVDNVDLHAHPFELAASGKLPAWVKNVPMVVGSVSDEGSGVAGQNYLIGAPEVRRRIATAYAGVMDNDRIRGITEDYLTNEIHYPTPGVISDSWWAQERALTDQSWGCAPGHAAEKLSSHGFQIYQYYFVHNGPTVGPPANSVIMALGTPEIWTSHADDISYTFGEMDLFPAPPISNKLKAAQAALSKTIRTYWYNLLTQKDPNSHGAPHWPRYDDSKPYMILDTTVGYSAFGPGGVRSKTGGLRPARCGFMNDWATSVIAAGFSHKTAVPWLDPPPTTTLAATDGTPTSTHDGSSNSNGTVAVVLMLGMVAAVVGLVAKKALADRNPQYIPVQGVELA